MIGEKACMEVSPLHGRMADSVSPNRPFSGEEILRTEGDTSHEEHYVPHNTEDVQKHSARSADMASRGPSAGRSEASPQVTELSESDVELEDIQPADDDSDFLAEPSPEESLRSDSGFDDDDSHDSRPKKRYFSHRTS